MKINEKNLCVFARTPPYDMEGFLYKRGEINKAFQRRYFVLKGNLLFYFETRMDKEPLGLIIVEGCTIELSPEPGVDNYCFEIAFNGNRTYILAADTQESMEMWMKTLTCAGYEYKRIIVSELKRQLQEIEDSKNKIKSDQRDEASVLVKPKPPPRRHNPFNPLPGTTAPDTTIPITEGYFGACIRNEHNMRVDDNESPLHTHKPTRPAPIANKTINNNNNSHVENEEHQRRIAIAIAEFKERHEYYRKELMPDIDAYRKSQNQLLIQF